MEGRGYQNEDQTTHHWPLNLLDLIWFCRWSQAASIFLEQDEPGEQLRENTSDTGVVPLVVLVLLLLLLLLWWCYVGMPNKITHPHNSSGRWTNMWEKYTGWWWLVIAGFHFFTSKVLCFFVSNRKPIVFWWIYISPSTSCKEKLNVSFWC